MSIAEPSEASASSSFSYYIVLYYESKNVPDPGPGGVINV
jgi:hypothetical protein